MIKLSDSKAIDEAKGRMPRVLLLPGLMGTGNLKRDALTQAGFDVKTVAFDDGAAADWENLFKAPFRHLLRIFIMLMTAHRVYARWVAEAQTAYDSFQPDLVVGASRGGSVAMTIHIADDVPMLLLAPAYKWFGWIGGRTRTSHPDTIVMHSKYDESIPFTDSVELCRKCPQVKLIEAGIDHSFNTPDAILAWMKAVRDLTTVQRA